jgi:hypothetical protein
MPQPGLTTAPQAAHSQIEKSMAMKVKAYWVLRHNKEKAQVPEQPMYDLLAPAKCMTVYHTRTGSFSTARTHFLLSFLLCILWEALPAVKDCFLREDGTAATVVLLPYATTVDGASPMQACKGSAALQGSAGYPREDTAALPIFVEICRSHCLYSCGWVMCE